MGQAPKCYLKVVELFDLDDSFCSNQRTPPVTCFGKTGGGDMHIFSPADMPMHSAISCVSSPWGGMVPKTPHKGGVYAGRGGLELEDTIVSGRRRRGKSGMGAQLLSTRHPVVHARKAIWTVGATPADPHG